MIGQVVMALVDVLGAHPEFNAPLGEAFKRRGVDLSRPDFTHIMCRNIGAQYTTKTFLLQDKAAGTWEARAGIAIMGSTNMSDEDLDRLSPFDDEFHDNYACGVGTSPREAVEKMNGDRDSIADSIFAE